MDYFAAFRGISACSGRHRSSLRTRDQEEVLCKMIIVEGIMSIQSGENPKFLKEKLMTFMSQQQREGSGEGGSGRGGRRSRSSEE